MAILEALVSFALAMLIFSTMVTAIGEVLLNRITKLRQRGFATLIDQIYDEVIVERISEFKEAGEDKKKEFVSALTANRGIAPKKRNKLQAIYSSGRISSLSTVEFIERIAETDIGKIIGEQAAEKKAALVDELALKFERFGDSSREYFRQRAQTFSILIAIGLALTANIDAVRLFKGLTENPAAREALLSQADQITAAANVGTPVPQEEKPKDEAAPGTQTPDPNKVIAETKSKLAEIGKEIDNLSQFGLAIGHGYFPMCSITLAQPGIDDQKIATAKRDSLWTEEVKHTFEVETKSEGKIEKKPEEKSFVLIADAHDLSCTSIRNTLKKNFAANLDNPEIKTVEEAFESTGFWNVVQGQPGPFLYWVMLCIVSGFLIGLGGPFWFNVFSNLNRVLQVARSVQSMLPKRKKTEEAEKSKESEEPAGAIQPKSPNEAFDGVRKAIDPAPPPNEPAPAKIPWNQFKKLGGRS